MSTFEPQLNEHDHRHQPIDTLSVASPPPHPRPGPKKSLTLATRLSDICRREFSIPSASILFMVAFCVSALLGVVRQILFNAQFGAGPEANAYYAAFRLPETITSLIAGGALSSAMIPVMLRTRRDEGHAAEQKLINLVLTSLLIVLVPLTLIGILITPAFVTTILAPGFDKQTSQLTITLTKIMLVQPPILVASTVAIAVMNSRNQFLLTALSFVCHNFTLVGGIFAARFYPSIGIYGPTIGLVSDAVLQTCLLMPGLRNNGFSYRPVWNLRDRRLREVIQLLIPNGLSVTANYAGTIVDTAFASMAREAAGPSALYNAFLLIGLPVRVLGLAIGQAAFPRFAAHATTLQWIKLRRTLIRSLVAATGLAFPVSLSLFFLGRLLIRALFEHGRFDSQAATLTYTLLVAYAVALPAYIGTEIISRGLIALYDTRTPLMTNICQVAGRAAIIALLLDQLGVVIIPIAFAVTSILEMLVLGAVLFSKIQRRLRGVRAVSESEE